MSYIMEKVKVLDTTKPKTKIDNGETDYQVIES